MKIGITLTPSRNGGTPADEAVRHLLWAAEFCDASGFDNVWTTEHHFTDVAFSSAPSVILSQFAARTTHVKLGYAVAILPLHHPLRLAEEMSWVDNFSGGRLIGGISPGWAPYEFDVLDVPLAERRERFAEAWDLMRTAFTGEKFSFNGRFWKVAETKLMPPFLQPGGPKMVLSATSDDSVRLSARLHMGPLLGYPPVEGVIRQRDIFLDEMAQCGYDEATRAELLGRLGVLRRVLICDTDEEAEQEAVDSAVGFRQNGVRQLQTTQRDAPIEGIVRRQAPQGEQDPRTLYAYTGTIWGSPRKVAADLDALRQAGVGHVIIQFHTTTRDMAGTKVNIRRFADEVLPLYHAVPAGAR